MRNQNIYTSQITQGLAVSVDETPSPLGKIQRGFPVRVENDSNTVKTYQLTIANQATGGPGVVFLQFSLVTQLLR